MNCTSIGVSAGALACAFVLHVPAAQAATESVVYSFCGEQSCEDGRAPAAGLLDVKGVLYGTTFQGGATCEDNEGCGTVFAINLKTGTETVLYSFCSQQNCVDGYEPDAGLIDVDGTLYGTTYGGGNTNCPYNDSCGTVFSINPKTGAETVVYAFCNPQYYNDGCFNTANNSFDGYSPRAGLINVNGTLYGTTTEGGDNGGGIVFAINPATGAETTVYSFGGYTGDGSYPQAGLTDVNGTLYGTTLFGGGGTCTSQEGDGCGTVFSLNPSNGAETVLYAFCSKQNCDGRTDEDGIYPAASLIAKGDKLYGTTLYGGTYDVGTVFSLSVKTGGETILHSFLDNVSDGQWPNAGLLDVKGMLYGTTSTGGTQTDGTVFSINPKTGAETVLYSFDSNGADDGLYPGAGLINVKGALYGTTTSGGTSGNGGTVFKLTQ